MAAFPGKSDLRSPPYSKPYAAGQASPVNLTTEIDQAPCATSGAVAIATATTCQLVYKDSSGTARDTGSFTAVVGDHFSLPFAMTELTTNTGLLVLAYWHGSNAR